MIGPPRTEPARVGFDKLSLSGGLKLRAGPSRVPFDKLRVSGVGSQDHQPVQAGLVEAYAHGVESTPTTAQAELVEARVPRSRAGA